ncbi:MULTISPECIES: hypothetical protein [unclassified Agrococcus]|uniref:hypothetical protein n=1 Tax=unclassified Agrococcus TaxID=2615065 RepID=UPI00360795BD
MRLAWSGDDVTADGRLVATVAQQWLRDRAEVRVDDETWSFRKDGAGGRWAASLDGRDRIVASSLSAWRMRWEVRAPSDVFEVRRTRAFLSTAFALHAGDAVIGEMRSEGFTRHLPALVAPDAMPVVEAAFVLWFVRRAVAREAAAASA